MAAAEVLAWPARPGWSGDEEGALLAMAGLAAAEGGRRTVGMASEVLGLEVQCTAALARQLIAVDTLREGARGRTSAGDDREASEWEGAAEAVMRSVEDSLDAAASQDKTFGRRAREHADGARSRLVELADSSLNLDLGLSGSTTGAANSAKVMPADGPDGSKRGGGEGGSGGGRGRGRAH